jgi:hypothetical protein
MINEFCETTFGETNEEFLIIFQSYRIKHVYKAMIIFASYEFIYYRNI